MITSLLVMLGLPNFGHMTIFTNDLSHVIKFFGGVMDINYDVTTFILRRPTKANCADIIKIPTIIKKPLKTQKRLKELKIMYSNAIYICISWYSKI